MTTLEVTDRIGTFPDPTGKFLVVLHDRTIASMSMGSTPLHTLVQRACEMHGIAPPPPGSEIMIHWQQGNRAYASIIAWEPALVARSQLDWTEMLMQEPSPE